MSEEATSSTRPDLGYSGCEVFHAKRVRRGHGVKKLGTAVSFDEAVTARRQGADVVVCGPSLRTNMIVAEQIESTATNQCHQFHAAHINEGPRALPHYQHRRSKGMGHTFLESPPDRLAMGKNPS